MESRASHRMNVWAPCFWANELLQRPRTDGMNSTLNSVGPRLVNPDGTPGEYGGHSWDERGAGPGWDVFYAGLEMEGAHWLWFTGLERDSQMTRFSRRSILAGRSQGSFFSKWVAERFVDEPRSVRGQVTGGAPTLTWTNEVLGALHPDFSHNRVYRGSRADYASMTLLADGVRQASYVDDTAMAGRTWYYAVVSVDVDGHESSKSDIITLTP